jgi:hypothetical protein
MSKIYEQSWIGVPETVSLNPKNKEVTYRLRVPDGDRIATAVFWKAPKDKSQYPLQDYVVLQVYPRGLENKQMQFPSVYVWILRWMLEHKKDLDLSMTIDNHHFSYHTIKYMPFKEKPDDTESATGEAEEEIPSEAAPVPLPAPPMELPHEEETTPFPPSMTTVLDDLTLLHASLIRAKRALLEIQPINQYAYLNVLNSMDILNDVRKNLLKM